MINVVEFAAERRREINSLEDALRKSSFESGGPAKGSLKTLRAFQTLPRHLRRRAMSHNVRRIPKYLRTQAQRELDAAPSAIPPKPHRRHKRRPKFLQQNYGRRQGQHQWLETHVWHAKRMKMVKRWGYHVALHHASKNVRASYKNSAHVCTVQDQSFMLCIELLVRPHTPHTVAGGAGNERPPKRTIDWRRVPWKRSLARCNE